jgi:Zn-finger nucleic acid-binding protein
MQIAFPGMKCPVCVDVDLSISSREGVEIDFCPQCRGVWLDRGELDKIIDRVAATPASPAAAAPAYADRPRDDDRDRRYEGDREWRGSDKDLKRRKRRSFLDDLFDFD